MTSLEVLNLTENQATALSANGVTAVEQIDGPMLTKMDGRISNGIGVKLEQWRQTQEPQPEAKSEESEPEEAIAVLWHHLTFGVRTANLREARGYVRKLAKHGMDYTAVLFDDLLIQVRDLFLEYGVSWHTIKTEIVSTRTHDRGDLLIMDDLIVFTFRFQCVEGQSSSHDGTHDPHWYRDIQVPARSFDVYDPNADHAQGDKGPGKAHTYAQKIALRTFLNLPAGDDPDFTPAASLGTREKGLRDERLSRLERALQAVGFDNDCAMLEQQQKLLAGLNEKWHRDVAAIEDTPDQILLGWCEHYEAKAKEIQNEAEETQKAKQLLQEQSNKPKPEPESKPEGTPLGANTDPQDPATPDPQMGF